VVPVVNVGTKPSSGPREGVDADSTPEDAAVRKVPLQTEPEFQCFCDRLS